MSGQDAEYWERKASEHSLKAAKLEGKLVAFYERKAFERRLEAAKLEGRPAVFVECDDPEACAQDHKKVHSPDEVIFGARDGKLKIYHKEGE